MLRNWRLKSMAWRVISESLDFGIDIAGRCAPSIGGVAVCEAARPLVGRRGTALPCPYICDGVERLDGFTVPRRSIEEPVFLARSKSCVSSHRILVRNNGWNACVGLEILATDSSSRFGR
jgi:hypothetical protein